MHNFSYGYEEPNRDELNQFLTKKRKDGNFKVLDVGGAVGPWFWKNTDVIMDFVCPKGFDGQYIEGNITQPEGWEQIFTWVKDNKKFDFVICRQTLEDISHPEFVVNQLQKVAKAGWIGVPSKQMELMRGWYPEIPQTRGLHHHRWIYVTKNGRWYGLPKMGWTDSIPDSNLTQVICPGNPKGYELSFYWEKEIDVFWVLPFTDNLPDDYGDDFVRHCLQDVKHPWDLWVKMLNESD